MVRSRYFYIFILFFRLLANVLDLFLGANWQVVLSRIVFMTDAVEQKIYEELLLIRILRHSVIGRDVKIY